MKRPARIDFERDRVAYLQHSIAVQTALRNSALGDPARAAHAEMLIHSYQAELETLKGAHHENEQQTLPDPVE